MVHVVDDDQPEELVELERREAAKLLNTLIASSSELQGVACSAVVAASEAFDGILRTAERCAADLIFMGSHRKELLRDVFVGTTIERVIRTGSFPVLMVNREVERPYQTALAAVDNSAPSAHALKLAGKLRLLDSLEVAVVHAFTAPAKGKLFLANATAARIEEYVASERLEAIRNLREFFAANGVRDPGWRKYFEEGDAAEAIARLVAETVPDLLIIGAHGRAGLAKLLFGSVAQDALRSLSVDILVVRGAS